MRRAILAVTIGGVLLTGSACDSDNDATSTNAAPAPIATPSTEAPSPAPDYTANTRLVCGNVQKIFTADLKTFATDLGKMIANKEAKQTAAAAGAQKAAGQQLKIVGAKLKKTTAAAEDPQLREAGGISAAKFAKSANDKAFFNKIKTSKDLDRIIEGQLNEWFTPVAGYCAESATDTPSPSAPESETASPAVS
jgi:hypothetical protein